MIKIKTICVFPNGMVAVFDDDGQQVPQYQGRWNEMKKLLEKGDIDTSNTEWMGVPFEDRIAIESRVKTICL